MPRNLPPPQRHALNQLRVAAGSALAAAAIRDRRVLEALAQGCPVVAVAAAAGLDPGTVRGLRDRATVPA